MHALASPGQIVRLDTPLAPPAPLFAPAAALLLTLCDFETPVWLDPVLADSAEVAAFLRFHTGARLVASPADAAFAVIADPARMPALAAFAQGTPDYPDRSTTLILQVETLAPTAGPLEGPGISGTARFSAAPLPADFAAQMRANRAAFPCGVDIFFADPHARSPRCRAAHAWRRPPDVRGGQGRRGGDRGGARAAGARAARRPRRARDHPPSRSASSSRLAVNRVMCEGSLYDPDLAALAIKQARGDLIEAIFLLRAYRTTLPRFGYAEPVDTGAMRIRRRISATYKDLPGGQVLGPTFDYTHRLLDPALAEAATEPARRSAPTTPRRTRRRTSPRCSTAKA